MGRLGNLSRLKALQELELKGCDALDNEAILVIADLTELQECSLWYSGNISDVTPFKDLANLRHLDLAYTGVTDLSPLAHRPDLVVVVGGDQSDFSKKPLEAMTISRLMAEHPEFF